MKAAVYTEYGPPEVLQIKEVEKPVPQETEVLVRVYASAVTTGDVNARGFVFVPDGLGFLPRLMFGLRQPKIQTLGVTFGGEVETVGKGVTQFEQGDQVYGMTDESYGAWAEYLSIPEDGLLAAKPANLSYEEAAAVPFGATTALDFLRDRGRIQSGQRVLVVGASGDVGTYGVQLAKYYGAEVTGVCSTANLELVRSLGADQVIDYTQEDFTQSGETYDAIYDTVGKTLFADVKDSLVEGGLYLAGAGGLREFVQMAQTSLMGSKKVIAGQASVSAENLTFLKELAEAGKIRPVIDRRYPLAQIVEANRHVDTGHKTGSVVIAVAQP
jgi:NADPH:quinone reductase-like Zn-dependent oxidoreductase